MKVCPKCGQAFNDDNLSFCLLDGEPLVPSGSDPTLVIPTTTRSSTTISPTTKKRSTWLWAGLGILVLIIGAAILIAVAIISYRIGAERARSNGSDSTNVASTTPRSSTPGPSPVSSPYTSNGEEENEVTPITWNTSAGQLKQDVGRTYRFECPKNGTPVAIWGSDIYTTDSSICSAAVHAGKITLQDGGKVTIELRPGRSVYGSTTQNGITSNTFGEFPHSFVFR